MPCSFNQSIASAYDIRRKGLVGLTKFGFSCRMRALVAELSMSLSTVSQIYCEAILLKLSPSIKSTYDGFDMTHQIVERDEC